VTDDSVEMETSVQVGDNTHSGSYSADIDHGDDGDQKVVQNQVQVQVGEDLEQSQSLSADQEDDGTNGDQEQDVTQNQVQIQVGEDNEQDQDAEADQEQDGDS
jgi:hypothetical protein